MAATEFVLLRGTGTATLGPAVRVTLATSNSRSHSRQTSTQTAGATRRSAHGQNRQTTNANDNVFSDGVTNELATVSGSVAAGYVAMLNVGIQI